MLYYTHVYRYILAVFGGIYRGACHKFGDFYGYSIFRRKNSYRQRWFGRTLWKVVRILLTPALLVTVFCVCFGYAYADTVIDSPLGITSPIVWHSSDGPFIIKQPVVVGEGASLDIEPGTIVKFADNSITVMGRLSALGSEVSHIKFTSFHNDELGGDSDGYVFRPSYRDGGGIYIKGAKASADISYADFSFFYNLMVVSSGSLRAENVSMTDYSLGVSGDSGAHIELSHIKAVREAGYSIFSSGDSRSWFGALREILVKKVYAAAIAPGPFFYLSGSYATGTDILIDSGISSAVTIYNSGGTPSNLYLSSTTINRFASGVMNMDSILYIASSTIARSGVGIYSYGTTTIEYSNIIENEFGGVVNNDWYGRTVDAKNVWWGNISGPYEGSNNPDGLGDAIEANSPVEFVPWLTAPYTGDKKPEPVSSVAFIPGFEATRLYTDGFLSENKLWIPNRNADAEKLALNKDGESVNSNIYTRDIVDHAGGAGNTLGRDVYVHFQEFLEKSKKDGVIKEFAYLPYDWRFSVDRVIARGTDIGDGNISYISSLPVGEFGYMIRTLVGLAERSPTGKVTIVAHSNGGLVTKRLVQNLVALKAAGKIDLVDKIDKVILIAVPELGTPKAVAGLLHGYDQGITAVLKTSIARALSLNMESAYGLLPSDEYFKRAKKPLVSFDKSIAVIPGFGIYASTTISTYDGMKAFLLGVRDMRKQPTVDDVSTPAVANTTLLTRSRALHADMDNWQYPANIKVYQVAGVGKPTPQTLAYKIRSDGKEIGSEIVPDFDGDGTVVSLSAGAIGTSSMLYYTNLDLYNTDLGSNIDHAGIIGIFPVTSLVSNLIQEKTDLPKYISLEKPEIKKEIKIIKMHSPADINVYDTDGNHTGLVQNHDPDSGIQFVEESIPNSSYVEFGEAKYIMVPSDMVNGISISGTGFGTFTLEQTVIPSGGGSPVTTAFVDVPVTPLTVGSVGLSASGTPELSVDINGDGTVVKVQPSVISDTAFDPLLYIASMKSFIEKSSLSKKEKEQLLKRLDRLVVLINKGKDKKIIKSVRSLVYREEHNKKHKHKFTSDDEKAVVAQLRQLLDNMGIK